MSVANSIREIKIEPFNRRASWTIYYQLSDTIYLLCDYPLGRTRFEYWTIRVQDLFIKVEKVEKLGAIPLEMMRDLTFESGRTSYLKRCPYKLKLPIILECTGLFLDIPFQFMSRDDYDNVLFDSMIASNGPIPTCRLHPRITYIPDEERYVLYGGYIQLKNLPQSYVKVCAEALNKGILEVGNNYCLKTDDIWIYDIKSRKWELVLEASPLSYKVVKRSTSNNSGQWAKENRSKLRATFPSSRNLQDAEYGFRSLIFDEEFEKYFVDQLRPDSASSLHFLHSKRHKIYYLSEVSEYSAVKSDLALFEFDYKSYKLKRIEEFDQNNLFGKILFSSQRFPIIDYSNNTFLLASRDSKGLWVVCFETYTAKYIQIKLPFFGFFKKWSISFSNNYKQLIIFPYPKRYGSHSVFLIDWEHVKTQRLQLFLDYQRALKRTAE